MLLTKKPSKRLTSLLSLVNEQSQPNISHIWRLTKDLEVMRLNLKFFGYELARTLATQLPPVSASPRRRSGSEVQALNAG